MVRRKGRDAAGGELLPGYADLQEIGGGAFATVFKAVETETGRPVALKILKVDTIHAHLIETFHHEIQALAAVSHHPNIVTLYRPSTTSDGRPVLVLELCRESLGQQLRASGPLTASEVTRVGIKIAGALETAHRNGFLHRDMKPQNILTTQFGEPALADFGVVALQASAQMTAGVFGFTTLHAAPEMLEGHHLSPATDVYGLASTMYQLLTGQAPFATFENEAPASVILRILRDPVRPLRAEHVPLGLADLLEAALSKEPEGRPRSAAEFATALQAVEAAQGWPETSFVAWGEEGVTPRPVATGRGPMGVLAGGPESHPRLEAPAASPGPEPPPASGPVAGAPAGAPRSEATAGSRSSLPPLLPPSAPSTPSMPSRHSTGSSSPSSPPSPATGSSSPAPGRQSPSPASPPPLPVPGRQSPSPASPSPLPAPGRQSPSVAQPERTVRQVVEPVEAVRGRFGPPPTPPDPAPPPQVPGRGVPPPAAGPGVPPPAAGPAVPPPAAGPAVPPPAPPSAAVSAGSAGEPEPPGSFSSRASDYHRFVDPDPPDGTQSSSVYEETMGVNQYFERSGREPASSSGIRPGTSPVSPFVSAARDETDSPGTTAYLPVWAVSAIAVAVLVIVAAILLLAGMI